MAETVTVDGETFPADLRVNPEESTAPAPEPPAEHEQPAETQAAPAEPAPTDDDSRAQLDRYRQRNEQLEDELRRVQQFQMQQFAQQQQQPPAHQQPPNVFDDPQLSPEWRESLKVIDQRLAPIIEQRIAQRFAPMQQESAESRVMSERVMLHQAARNDPRYADYPQLEPQVLAVRQQLAAQRSPLANVPLEALYRYLRFEAPQTQAVQQAEQRGAQRARAAQSAGVSTASPAGSVRSGKPSVDQMLAMPTKDLEREIQRGLASGDPAWRYALGG